MNILKELLWPTVVWYSGIQGITPIRDFSMWNIPTIIPY